MTTLWRVTQDGWVMVESSDKTGPLAKGMANHFSILASRAPWTVWKDFAYTGVISTQGNLTSALMSLPGLSLPVSWTFLCIFLLPALGPVNSVFSGVWGDISVVLICISIVISDVEHIFMYFLVVSIFFKEISFLVLCTF